MIRGSQKYLDRVHGYTDQLSASVEESNISIMDKETVLASIQGYRRGFDAVADVDKSLQNVQDTMNGIVESLTSQVSGIAEQSADTLAMGAEESTIRTYKFIGHWWFGSVIIDG